MASAKYNSHLPLLKVERLCKRDLPPLCHHLTGLVLTWGSQSCVGLSLFLLMVYETLQTFFNKKSTSYTNKSAAALESQSHSLGKILRHVCFIVF